MPPKPKPESAARRGVFASRRAHGDAAVGTANGLPSKAAAGFAAAKFAFGGIVSRSKASRTFMSPAAPAAVSMWPTLDFTEPMAHCPAVQPRSPHKALRLAASTGSPVGVPVARHSTKSICDGDRAAS